MMVRRPCLSRALCFPLILVGGAWGYWGPGHVWFRAPDAVFRHLEGRRRAGVVFRVGAPAQLSAAPVGGRSRAVTAGGGATATRASEHGR